MLHVEENCIRKEQINERKITVLFNTLAQIETKGDGTLKMAGCLQHLQQMIAEREMQEKTSEQNKDKK